MMLRPISTSEQQGEFTDAEVTADGAGGSLLGVGGTDEGTSSLDDILAFEDEGADGAAGEVLHQTAEALARSWQKRRREER